MEAVDIANNALRHLGISKTITSITGTDTSTPALVAGDLYDVCRQELLEIGNWPFATKFAELTAHATAQVEGFEFVYSRPSSCIKVVRIFPAGEVSARTNAIYEYKECIVTVGETDVQLIASNLDEAWCEYTFNLQTVDAMSPTFHLALSYKLAFEMAQSLSANADVRTHCRQMYLSMLGQAQQVAARTGYQKMKQGKNRYVAARGGNYGDGE